MEHSDSDSSSTFSDSLSKKDDVVSIRSKMTNLNDSGKELIARMQGLKQEMQNWRLKFDAQVMVFKNDLSELKKTLNVEVEQIKSEFQELKKTLQQQQEDITSGLRDIVLQDVNREADEAKNSVCEGKSTDQVPPVLEECDS